MLEFLGCSRQSTMALAIYSPLRAGILGSDGETMPISSHAIQGIDIGVASVVTRVRSVRVIALSGQTNFVEDGFEVPRATGVIEVLGARAGRRSTVLKIGFTDEPDGPGYSLARTEHELVGTLQMPSALFAPYLTIANSANAHLRLGDDGKQNALASDQSILE